MDLPPSNHFIYIPVMLMLGLAIGFIMGSRSAKDEMRVQQIRAEAREEKRAARRAKAQAEAPGAAQEKASEPDEA